MAQFTVNVAVFQRYPAQRYATSTRSIDPYQLATIEWGPGQLTGFVNKAAALPHVPDTLVISDARIAPDGFKRPKREGDIESGVVGMQTAKVKLQDKGRAFSQLVSTKRANGVGLRGKILRMYEWEAGSDVSLTRSLVGTYRLDDRGWADGYKSLTGLDIRRQLKEDIFEPQVYRLMSEIGTSTTTFTIKLDYEYSRDAMPCLKHNGRYSSNPDETLFYFQTQKGEIIACPKSGLTGVAGQPYHARVTKAVRGALNTRHLIASVAVDDTTEDDNKPSLTEWIYLEETLPDFIKMITTGFSYDGRAVPRHWHIDLDDRWLDTDSLLFAAPELASMPLRAENFGSTSVKELLEDEILPFMPATMQVSPEGKIQIRRITTIKKVGADVIRFDSSSINRESLTEVKTMVSHIKSGIAIRAGYDARTELFGPPIFFVDAAAQAANDATLDAEPLILESKLLHSSIHTNAQIRRLLPALAEHYLGEKLVFSLTMNPSAAIVDVGSRAHVYIEGVPDDATLDVGTPDIDRSFLITSVDVQQAGTTYQFKGTSGLGDNYYDALNAPALADSDYLLNATPLRDDLPAGSIVESNGVYYLQPGNYHLSFRKKYVFMDGPLSHTEGSKIFCDPGQEGPMFQLWVPHAWHSDSPETITTIGKGTKGGGGPGEVGDSGYAVPTVGVGSLNLKRWPTVDTFGAFGRWESTSSPGVQYESYTTGDMPSLSLSFNDGALVGLPTDLSGYPGVGGGSIFYAIRNEFGSGYTNGTVIGSAGARNSSGVMIICRGGTMAPAARIVVDGMDGPLAEIAYPPISVDTEMEIHTSPGSGSGPGSVLFAIDGPFTGPDNLPGHVEAHPGMTRYMGARPPSAAKATSRRPPERTYYEALPHTVNLSEICTRTVSLPARARVQEASVRGIFSSLAISRQRDGLIRLIPMDNPITSDIATHPSDGDPGDFAIWQADLDGNSAEPPAWIMTDDYKWVRLNWATAPNDYATLLIVNRRGGGTISIMLPTRPVGYPAGTHWLNSSNGTEWILGETSAEDEPFRDLGVPVGDELIINGNFAQGMKHWLFTRNGSLLPKNILAILVDQIAQAFITQGVLEGEFEDLEDAQATESTTVLPVVSMSAVGSSSSEITVSWVQQSDITGIAGVQIKLNDGIVDAVTTSPRVITGLSSNTTFEVSIRNIGTNGNLSSALSETVTTQAVGGSSQIGISFTDTGGTLSDQGRRVAGTAYQDNQSTVIAQGREISLTLFDGYVIRKTVGAGGAFEFFVPTSKDSNLNKLASVYTNNGTDSTRALTEFTYEL